MRRTIRSGRGAGPIAAFATSGHSVRIACEASDFEPQRWLDRKTIRKIDRFAQFAVAAARMAEEDAGLDIAPAQWSPKSQYFVAPVQVPPSLTDV